MTTQEVKTLFEAFVQSYDQEKSKNIWKKQSPMFKNFWQTRIMTGNNELSEDEMQPIIMILDCNAKGIRNSGIEAACRPFGVTQNRWYRFFRELKGDNKLKSLVDRLFRSTCDEEQMS